MLIYRAIIKDERLLSNTRSKGFKNNAAHIETKRKRKLIKQATDYALNILGMEEVFVNISTTDEKLMTSMELEGYEPITDETGNLFFLKDKGFI